MDVDSSTRLTASLLITEEFCTSPRPASIASKSGPGMLVTVAGRVTQPASDLTRLNSPKSVTLDVDGRMCIAHTGKDRILRWAPHPCAGECLAGCAASLGTRPDQLHSPFMVTFDSQGSLDVSDSMHNRVQRFAMRVAIGTKLL